MRHAAGGDVTSTPMPARDNGARSPGDGKKWVPRTGTDEDDLGTPFANPLDCGRTQMVGAALVEVRREGALAGLRISA